ncbi:hypothetical protein [Actinomadura rugatobispora]|uniref:Uncharacterized protein n=1 Tax=Actinomadura rugatobispora TaxID=1994 RepID=A0ABW1AH56_9ACTN|nr:hypothetical protein GCM10010200_031850 [Actinomadura rugatobispora]
MTDWIQHHPTTPMTTRDGRAVEIDVEIAPLVEQLWRLGYTTKLACQDAGEAILHGGTRVAPSDRDRQSACHAGRAWIIVGVDDGPALLKAVRSLASAGTWRSFPVTKGNDPEAWMSITFPRRDITAAAELLRRASAEDQAGSRAVP